jgi:hypothetical protein
MPDIPPVPKLSKEVPAPPKAALRAKRVTKDGSIVRKKSIKDYLRQTTANEGKVVPAAFIDPATKLTLEDGLSNDHEAFSEASLGAELNRNTESTISFTTNRIIELENALKRSFEEVALLKEEIDQLKIQKPQDSLPHAGAFSDVHALTIDEQPSDEEMTDEDVRLQDEVYDLRVQLSEMHSEMTEQGNIWKLKWEKERHDRILERNAMAEELHNTQKEIIERRQQLLDLKQSLSSLTHRDNQVTDGELSERMDGLFHRIREWVVSNFRRSSLGISHFWI